MTRRLSSSDSPATKPRSAAVRSGACTRRFANPAFPCSALITHSLADGARNRNACRPGRAVDDHARGIRRSKRGLQLQREASGVDPPDRVERWVAHRLPGAGGSTRSPRSSNRRGAVASADPRMDGPARVEPAPRTPRGGRGTPPGSPYERAPRRRLRPRAAPAPTAREPGGRAPGVRAAGLADAIPDRSRR